MLEGAEILLQNAQTDPESPSSLLFSVNWRSFPGAKRSGREIDRSRPSSAEVKDGESYTSTPSLRLGCVGRDDFTFIEKFKWDS